MTASIPADQAQDLNRPDPIVQFLRAPFQARSYANLIYLLMSLPLGIFHFTFVTTGLSTGVGLLITVLGVPIIGLTLWGGWWLSALERQIAISLLGAKVPPMGTAPFQTGQGFRRDIEEFLGNQITWTGLIFLSLKLPLGIFSFVLTVTMIAVSTSLLLVPFLYPLSFIEWDGLMLMWVDSPAEAALCFFAGLLFTYVSLLLLNGLAAFWRWFAVVTLGSARYAEPSPPAPLPLVGEGEGWQNSRGSETSSNPSNPHPSPACGRGDGGEGFSATLDILEHPLAGHPLRLSDARPQPRHLGGGARHARSRDRGEHGHLQRGQRLAAEAAAVSRARRDRPRHGEQSGAGLPTAERRASQLR